MNIELLKRVREQIALEDTHFDMDNWGVALQDGQWVPEYEDLVQENACETPACIAGWTIRLGLPQKEKPVLHHSGLFLKYEDPADDISEKAIELLGIEHLNRYLDEEHPLFFVDRWPTWANRLAHAEGEKAAAIALLDKLINGEDPWGADDEKGD